MHEFVSISADVKLGREVKLSKFINLYGCSVGDHTKIGATDFVKVCDPDRIDTVVTDRHNEHLAQPLSRSRKEPASGGAARSPATPLSAKA